LTFTNRWERGDLGLGWNINYIGKNGEGANLAPSYVTHDFQAKWATPLKGATLTFGILNAFEKFPALIGSPYDQKPFNYYLYDMYGRQFYVRGEMKF
jgi:iron complex outermembrane receptor protein